MGLWNYCEGYGNGVTDCSKPKTLYWSNPVQIFLSELLSSGTSTSRLLYPSFFKSLKLSNCSPTRDHLCPRAYPPRSSLDVHPLPHRRLHLLGLRLPHAPLNLHPLGHLPHCHLRILFSPHDHSSKHDRYRHVYHL